MQNAEPSVAVGGSSLSQKAIRGSSRYEIFFHPPDATYGSRIFEKFPPPYRPDRPQSSNFSDKSLMFSLKNFDQSGRTYFGASHPERPAGVWLG
jgi:hypothetical protein